MLMDPHNRNPTQLLFRSIQIIMYIVMKIRWLIVVGMIRVLQMSKAISGPEIIVTLDK